jgi:hypothetical protein
MTYMMSAFLMVESLWATTRAGASGNPVEGGLYQALRDAVQGACGLVEHQYLGFPDNGPGDSDALSLAG